MEYKEFFKRIDELRGAFLFSGEEEFVKNKAMKALRAKHLPQGMESLNETVFEGGVDFASVESSCETMPFLGDVRLVVMKDSPLVSSQGKGKGSADQSMMDAMCDYAAKVPDHTVLVLYARGDADKRKKLVQILASMDRVVNFPELTDGDVIGWCTKYCASFGKKVEASAIRKLMELSGKFLHDVKDGLDKAISFVGEADAILAADIAKVVLPSPEYRGYQMASALLDAKSAETMLMIKQLVTDGERALGLLGSIERAVNQHLSVKLMTESRQPPEAIAATVGLSPGAVRAIGARARSVYTDALMAAAEMCNNANLAMKTTSMGEDMALSRLYMVVFGIIGLLSARGNRQ